MSIVTAEGLQLDLVLAGLGSRFAAEVLDTLIQATVVVALVLLGGLGAGGAIDGGGAADPPSGFTVAVVVSLLLLLEVGYHVLFETLASGRTPGKRATGLRVVRVNGFPPGFLTSAVRNLLRLIDVLPATYVVGTIAVLASSRNQRLGDMAAGTVVVRERRVGSASGPSPQGWPGASPAVLHCDVSSVTAEELATVRRFLDRRSSLTHRARRQLAHELALRLRPKVVGLPGGDDPELFLENLAAIKAERL